MISFIQKGVNLNEIKWEKVGVNQSTTERRRIEMHIAFTYTLMYTMKVATHTIIFCFNFNLEVIYFIVND